jgi:hypothetical protein
VCGRVGRRGWLPGTPEESFEELERDAHAGRTVKFDLRCSADEKLRWAEAASTLGLSVREPARRRLPTGEEHRQAFT